MIVALFATRFVPKNWRGLTSPILSPLIVCGEQSLSVFCAGVFLSFAGHFVLVTGSGSVAQQILVSLCGIVIMTLVANYVSWSKRQDGVQYALRHRPKDRRHDRLRDGAPLAPVDRRTSLKAG